MHGEQEECPYQHIAKSPSSPNTILELMELENIVANTVYLKAREGNRSDLGRGHYITNYGWASIYARLSQRWV